ncbi:hypothetical protein BU14_1150s0004 [Porphyra umbilicalis]|uniref:Protein kinase domain-containing protein n=1 Tax=Porphyra umbilicalis TaxID=2786 RepID=A0A1X6NMD1_PORUM|nr:hypothetical protein BU14_1150s0004 [Porphyra umbilicalis]|eukprot:OSX69791.1 hypothetical protein BU14_1150s0004 [Porphyra umbilicalis]
MTALALEVRVASTVRHPHLVAAYETYVWKGSCWVAMEYCGGGSLTDVLDAAQARGVRLPEGVIAYVLGGVLGGLGALHGMRRLHRDVKSDNLGDLGFCAELTEERGKRTSVVGTPYWMAPELIRSRHYDYKADIWSLGIVGLELADYEPPHMAEAAMRAMFLIATQAPPTLKAPATWSPAYRAFLGSCLVADPAGRAGVAQLRRSPFLRSACSGAEFVAFLATLGMGVEGVFAGGGGGGGGGDPVDGGGVDAVGGGGVDAAAAAATPSPPPSVAVQ